ncbi:MAG TPA: hypothetical protein VIY48_07625 [Candidatus Paceibacterota bacterium]
MSMFEKIASIIIAILVLGIVAFSYRELTERKVDEHESRGPSFEQSVGQDFKIGPFATVLNQSSSGSVESDCEHLQPVIVGVLHDIKMHLEDLNTYSGMRDVFEVNQDTLQLFCNKNASVTLVDQSGTKLVLEKVPFVRATPSGGTAADIGTDVRINATVIVPGTVPPKQPTTWGEELIPDRFLDIATSSSR